MTGGKTRTLVRASDLILQLSRSPVTLSTNKASVRLMFSPEKFMLQTFSESRIVGLGGLALLNIFVDDCFWIINSLKL